MLLFDNLYDVIINQLIIQKGISVKDLHTVINKQYNISLPNFYKVIKKLTSNQILIKENGKLSFHNRWILGFIDLAEELKKTYLVDKDHILSLEEGQSIYYEGTSIENIDGVRGDWMLSINRLYNKTEASYVYQAHPYYALGMNSTEMSFFEQANKITDVYFMSGNTNYLDIYGTNLYKEIGIKAIANDELPFMKDNYCITIVGDYVFEVLYPKDIGEYFKIFFDTIKDIKDFNTNLFQHIFKMKAECKLTLRHDKIHANNIKKVFSNVFKDYKN